MRTIKGTFVGPTPCNPSISAARWALAFRGLFLKEVIECAAGVRRFDRGCLGTAATGVSRLPLNRRARHEELTIVPKILLGDTCGDWLRALELSSRIEVAAILARTEIRFALRTLTFKGNLDRWREDRSAQRAPKDFLKSRHLHRPGCFSGLRSARSALGLLAWFLSFAFAAAAAITVIIHVAPRPVFTFHRNG